MGLSRTGRRQLSTSAKPVSNGTKNNSIIQFGVSKARKFPVQLTVCVDRMPSMWMMNLLCSSKITKRIKVENHNEVLQNNEHVTHFDSKQLC